ncbi:MAG: hypothetical protein JWO70_3099 [Betaproteobacteria bacterium]|jgi:hypothetical protein|nr:hypothetical protein [Betaproteobacteria bacterium]
MKRIATALLVATLATAGTAAFADEHQSFISEFPNMRSYADTHLNDRAGSPSADFPSSVSQEIPMSAEFPNMDTYKREHRSDAGRTASTPTFPYSVPNEQSMADEGLVPGIAGVPPADGAVGATR